MYLRWNVWRRGDDTCLSFFVSDSAGFFRAPEGRKGVEIGGVLKG